MPGFLVAACMVLLAMPLTGQQQGSSAPPAHQNSSSSSSQKKNSQQPSAHKPSTAEQNPFPEAQSEAAAHEAQQEQHQQDQDATPSAPAPQPADQAKPKSPAAEQNPFPEQQSEKAARQDQQQDSSGSTPPSYSSSQSGLKGLDIPETNRDARSLHDPNLGKKDTEIGMFYLKTSNYKGAYDRFSEANRIDPTNADAVFGLAESARHLDRRDEAIRNYRIYLSALPDGPRARAARKGLKDLGVSPNS